MKRYNKSLSHTIPLFFLFLFLLLFSPISLSQAADGPLPSRQTHLLEFRDRSIPAETAGAKKTLHHPDFERFSSFETRDHPLFDYYLARYSEPDRIAWLSRSLERSSYYRKLVFEMVEQADVPRALLFLPVVESAYYPYALSRSGAAGLWQFMTNSIKPYDMRIDSWVDERRDFWKASEAAVHKLQYNYSILGNWPLAIAAYNCGLTRMKRIVKEAGTDDFWKLLDAGALPRETAHFIPKFCAILHIIFNKHAYGVPITWNEGQQWERIRLETAVDIRLLAEKSGTPPELLRWGNSELNYYITPPINFGYMLKIPVEYSEVIKETVTRGGDGLIRFHLYTIRSGDTLSELAEHYEVTVRLIMQYNPGIRPETLRIGSRIVIPYYKEIPPYKGGGTGDDTSVLFTAAYTVKKGESLWSISRKFNTTPELLADVNSLPLHSYLRIGQTLKVPARKGIERKYKDVEKFW